MIGTAAVSKNIDQSPRKEAELALQMLRDYHTSDRVVQPAPINIAVFFRENLLKGRKAAAL